MLIDNTPNETEKKILKLLTFNNPNKTLIDSDLCYDEFIINSQIKTSNVNKEKLIPYLNLLMEEIQDDILKKKIINYITNTEKNIFENNKLRINFTTPTGEVNMLIFEIKKNEKNLNTYDITKFLIKLNFKLSPNIVYIQHFEKGLFSSTTTWEEIKYIPRNLNLKNLIEIKEILP